MTEDGSEEQTKDDVEDKVEDPVEFFTDNKTRTAKFTHRGYDVKVEYKEVTRGNKYEAMEQAALAYMEKNPNAEEPKPLPSVLEKELVKRTIVDWNLPKRPELGWELINDDKLAERVLKETGIQDALNLNQEEAQEAKN